jgi:Family of unknown function (DUF6159)
MAFIQRDFLIVARAVQRQLHEEPVILQSNQYRFFPLPRKKGRLMLGMKSANRQRVIRDGGINLIRERNSFMGRITRTWSLMGECWQVLKQDKSLLIFPFISGICCLLLMASFAVPFYLTGAWRPPGPNAAPQHQVFYYGMLFSFYVANYFVVVFFNAAIVACVATRMGGGEPTVGDGLRAAASRLPVILGWAVVSATVGLILRIIEDRSDKIGQIVAGLLGMAWTLVSFLVVPVLVIENKNPIAALQESTALLKKTWGEQVVSNFSFGGIFFLLMLPAVLLVVAAFYLGGAMIGIPVTALAVLYWIVLALVQSALQAIFQTALYLYARDGMVPQGFDSEVLGTALR